VAAPADRIEAPQSQGAHRVRNAITVDVEDYFQVSAFDPYINRTDWDRFPSRVQANTERILELFEEHNVQGTFFVLGWIAERHPDLIRRIVASGQELASHGYGHIRIYRQQPEDFREDVIRTKKLLEDLGGCEVQGYRAPSFSIRKDTLWAVEI
jgi:polysaccharide deacetylase family protein (PEP-CTERM system associated)